MQANSESSAAERGPSIHAGIAASPLSAVPAGARSHRKSGWPEWCVLASYAALVAFAIPYHEPWVDEAQAWQLARSLPLSVLFEKFIRYEGSPGLWHFLLWILCRLHVTYNGLHWISGGIAVLGVALLVFESPLPRYLKLNLPFTYFLLFQYAIIARNYVLVPSLLFLVAMVWNKKKPLGLALTLGLLANTALHAAVISGGLAAVYGIEWLREPKSAARIDGRRLALPVLLLLAFYTFAIWTAWPSGDIDLTRVLGDSRPILTKTIQSLTWAICQPAILSVAFWFALTFWFVARRKLLYLLPIVLFASFSGLVHFEWWHAGLLVPLLITLLWITWSEPGTGPVQFEKAAHVALVVMIATQVLWSGYAYWVDHFYAYSPDPAAAKFLEPYVAQGARTIVTFDVNGPGRPLDYPEAGIEPYFDHNIFANVPYPFWWWSDLDPTETRFHEILPSHPRFVLVEVVDPKPIKSFRWNDPVFVSLAREGYSYRSSFCGSRVLQFEMEGAVCHVFLEYPQKAGPLAK